MTELVCLLCARASLCFCAALWEGVQMAGKVPQSRAYRNENIDRRVIDVISGGNYLRGPESQEFDKELAGYFNVRHVVLSKSRTAADHLLHVAKGLKPGDEVRAPSLTAFPNIEPMVHVGHAGFLRHRRRLQQSSFGAWAYDHRRLRPFPWRQVASRRPAALSRGAKGIPRACRIRCPAIPVNAASADFKLSP